MSLEKRALKGTIASVIALVVQLGLQIVSVPVLLDRWGEEEYGIWLAINSLFGLLITIDGGHQNYVGNELMKALPIGPEPTKRVLQAGVAGAILTASLELVVVLLLGVTGVLLSLAGLSQDRSMDLWVCIGILLTMWVTTGSVGGIVVRLYQPMGEFARATWIGVVQRTLGGFSPVVVAALGGDIRHATLAASIVSSVTTVFIFNDMRRFREFHPFIARPDWRLVWSNLFRSVWLTATGFIAQAQQHFFLLIVAGSLGGVAALPAFTTLRTVANIFLQGANTLSAPLLPDIIRFRSAGHLDKLEVILRSLAALTSYLMGAAVILALPILPTAYGIWTRGHTEFNSPLYALLASAVLVRVLGSPIVALLVGLNALGPQLVGASLQSLTTLGAAALLVPLDGLRGAGAAILFGEIVGSLVVPIFALRVRERELTGLVTFRGTAVAVSSALIAVTLLLAHAYLAMPAAAVTVVGAVALLVTTMPLWRSFPEQMRSRLLKLARPR